MMGVALGTIRFEKLHARVEQACADAAEACAGVALVAAPASMTDSEWATPAACTTG